LECERPFDLNGKYFKINSGILLPRPARPGGPSILIGGNGPKRTLPLVAKYADEWNALYIPIKEYQQLDNILNQHLETHDRSPANIYRSLMTGCVYARNQNALKRKVSTRTGGKKTPRQLFERDLLVGTAHQIVDLLGRWSQAGIQRVMIQWLDLEDLDGLEGFAHQVLPQLQ
jgi:alkanesulfonate monooxygenase SsuD/methylene tetrahydromethanopterin reductase-like flavin-dependent oxidoreductase (luciferase family)